MQREVYEESFVYTDIDSRTRTIQNKIYKQGTDHYFTVDETASRQIKLPPPLGHNLKRMNAPKYRVHGIAKNIGIRHNLLKSFIIVNDH